MGYVVVVAVQLLAATSAAGVAITGIGFGSGPDTSKLLVMALLAAPVALATWLAGRLGEASRLIPRASWTALLGAVIGAVCGYLLIAIGLPQRLVTPGIDSIYAFTLCAAIPALIGYWLFR
ncbi:MAG TPA: hypothetical protein VH858_07360 [Hyphomicrobiales bacterium]|jgi:hypothetical protein